MSQFPNKIDNSKSLFLRNADLSAYPELEAARKTVQEQKGIRIFAVDQQRGKAQFVKGFLTVPTWVWSPLAAQTHKMDSEYWIYYLAHEIAHHLAVERDSENNGHGKHFYDAFKKICPAHLQHHELAYKPVAANYGISALTKPSEAKAQTLTESKQTNAFPPAIAQRMKGFDRDMEALKAAFRQKLQAKPAEQLAHFSETDALLKRIQQDAAEQHETDEPVAHIPAKPTQFSTEIVLNERQQLAADYAFQGRSFCLTGAAGTGKTTALRAVGKALLQQGKLSQCSYKVQGEAGARVNAPSFVCCAYTRKAAATARRAFHSDPLLKKEFINNVMTIHALLEYEPETYEAQNEKGEWVTRFRFVPRRNKNNPLTITHLVIEESSMCDLELWFKLYDALPEDIQIIFVGDLNQLPPVFGDSILNYALTALPTVELTEVYRNIGIVLENAHKIKGGQLPEGNNEEYKVLFPNKNTGQMGLANGLAANFKNWVSSGLYNPEEDIILVPWNKQELGTQNFNYKIADFLGQMRGAVVHQVIAGFNKLYLAEGDRVFVDKREAVISKIEKNVRYVGKQPKEASVQMNRWGAVNGLAAGAEEDDPFHLDYSEFSVEELEKEGAERKQQASHVITISFTDVEETETRSLQNAGEFQEQVFQLGYCLTCHKAQGSEWTRVFILWHKDHRAFLTREWFYTSATRARTHVTLIGDKVTIETAISRQKLKGESLAEKISYFNSGIKQVRTDVKIPGAFAN